MTFIVGRNGNGQGCWGTGAAPQAAKGAPMRASATEAPKRKRAQLGNGQPLPTHHPLEQQPVVLPHEGALGVEASQVARGEVGPSTAAAPAQVLDLAAAAGLHLVHRDLAENAEVWRL